MNTNKHKHLVRKPTSKEREQLFLLCAGTRGLPDGIREKKTDQFIEDWFEELGFLRKHSLEKEVLDEELSEVVDYQGGQNQPNHPHNNT